MGMPACRITDQTAHGGIVILGFPTVLIGGLPASRIGDMHTCPMVDVLVPHVGGPFILGSPTVLVGMMPQSRVTDQLTCVGPPDVAIMGEVTVLVGMAGAAGAAGATGGAAAMSSSAPVAAAAASPAAKGPSPARSAAAKPPGGAAASANPPAATAPAVKTATARVQPDGAVQTSALAGQSLPPVLLQQAGWPDLPPEATVAFESVQPAAILPGTVLFAAAAPGQSTAPSFWSDTPPPTPEDISILVHTVPPGPAKQAWVGKPATHTPRQKPLANGRNASEKSPDGHGRRQIWLAPGSVSATHTRRQSL